MAEKKRKGIIFVISGPSGVGKTTLYKKILKKRKDIRFSISHATREPRKGEREGKEYFFIKEPQFLLMIKKNSFIEWAKVHNHYYGTHKKWLSGQTKQGRNILLDIDVQGVKTLKKVYKEKNIVYIFIAPPSEKDLLKRIKGRKTETKESLKVRVSASMKEMKAKAIYDYIIENDIIKDAVLKLDSIIISEQCRNR